MDGTPLLAAHDLVRTFRTGSRLRPVRVRAVSGVDLEVAHGEVLGIVGESGCGKSTLARMLVGLDRPDSGSLRYRGHDVTAGDRRARGVLRGGVQLVFQDPYTSLDPRRTVLDTVAEPIDTARAGPDRAARSERVAELLELVGLPADAVHRRPGQFSGGQRQRIGIARALAARPDVLVCDEAVSALDVSVQAQVVNLLARLRRELGLAVVFIAHDLSVVRHLADRVGVMYLGRMVESGPVDAVFDHPAHPYTAALLGAAPTLERANRRTRPVPAGGPPSPSDPPAGCHFHPRCPLVTPECLRGTPPTVSVSPEHSAACLRAADVAPV